MLPRCLTRILSLAVFSLAVTLFPFALAQNISNPWSPSQTVPPGDLLKELSDAKTAPTVLFVGFQRLYIAGHIKGAQFHGTGGNPEALQEIKTWAATLPKTTRLVIYCGCCPMEHCPTVRSPFTALREMGFSKLRVLILPTSVEVDW